MANKDFFDDEYDKIEQQKANEQADRFNDWYAQQPAPSKQKNSNKPLFISLLCIALVMCIVLGWVMCAIFSNFSRTTGDQSALFDDVLKYLEKEYYQEIPDEKMWAAMESAGTAMLQNAGDQFSRLMSPSTYYEFCNPTSSYENENENGMFGISFQFVEGIGMYIYDVVTDGSAYGKLQESDIVVKITDIQTIDSSEMEDISANAVSQKQSTSMFENVKSATFHVLRDGAVFQCNIERGFTDYVNPDYKFEFIEFYFGDKCTNVSTSNMGTADTNTKKARKLDELNSLNGVGYIRIKEFSHIYVTDEKNPNKVKTHSVVDEFKIAMDLFKSQIVDKNGVVVKKPLKYLILDLKGNPGGNVGYVTEIAGMLTTNSKLSVADRKRLDKGKKGYVMTTLVDRNGNSDVHCAPLLYESTLLLWEIILIS